MTEKPRVRSRERGLLEGSEPPKPFLRTPIGLRVLLLALLLTTAAMMLWSRERRADQDAKARSARAAEAAASAPVAPTEEQLSERRRKLSTAFEGALNDTVNGDDFVETPGYRRLIEILAASSSEDVARRASNYLDHAAAMATPDMFRGEYVRVRGLLGGLSAYKLDAPVHDITDVWRGTIAQPDGEQDTVVLDLVGEPPELELRRSVVEVEGLLYRTVAYESRSGEQRVAPYLLARSVRVLPGRAGGSHSARTRLMVTACGVGAIVVYFLIRYSARARSAPRSRRPAGFKQMFESRSGAARPEPKPREPHGS